MSTGWWRRCQRDPGANPLGGLAGIKSRKIKQAKQVMEFRQSQDEMSLTGQHCACTRLIRYATVCMEAN